MKWVIKWWRALRRFGHDGPWQEPKEHLAPEVDARTAIIKMWGTEVAMTDMIKRDDVLALLERGGTIDDIRKLPSWPAPNPEGRDGRNIMGQTEDEFWDMVDRR